MAYDNTMDINPEQMTEVSGNIRNIGKNYNEKITALFNKITEMNNDWSGAEYDAAKTKFEESKPTLDELGTLIGTTIPQNIDTAVENYNNVQSKIRSMFG